VLIRNPDELKKRRERERADERTKEGSSKVKAYSETGLDFRKISMVFRVLSFRNFFKKNLLLLASRV